MYILLEVTSSLFFTNLLFCDNFFLQISYSFLCGDPVQEKQGNEACNQANQAQNVVVGKIVARNANK